MIFKKQKKNNILWHVKNHVKKKSCEIQISMSIKKILISLIFLEIRILLYSTYTLFLISPLGPQSLNYLLSTIYFTEPFGDPWCKWLISNTKSPLCGEKCISKEDQRNEFSTLEFLTKQILLRAGIYQQKKSNLSPYVELRSLNWCYHLTTYHIVCKTR